MNNIEIEDVASLTQEWLQVTNVIVGRQPKGEPSPSFYVLVRNDAKALLRLDVYPDHSSGMDHIGVWKEYVYVGIGQSCYFVHLSRKSVMHIICEGYFSSAHELDDRFYICSASEVLALDIDLKIVWRSVELGIDGVCLTQINNERIYGEGEWDPPGGWRKFVLDAKSGVRLKD